MGPRAGLSLSLFYLYSDSIKHTGKAQKLPSCPALLSSVGDLLASSFLVSPVIGCWSTVQHCPSKRPRQRPCIKLHYNLASRPFLDLSFSFPHNHSSAVSLIPFSMGTFLPSWSCLLGVRTLLCPNLIFCAQLLSS